jgi:FtsP/CotA-like multicopper oxidase with cupredoxin domain
LGALGLLLAAAAGSARADVPGLTGPSFALAARADRISTPEGGSYLFWGFSAGSARPQYPGPTLIVNQGDAVTVAVTNQLPATYGQRVSLSFPGQSGVTASCTADPCVQGPIAMEAGTGGTVTYAFTAARPGTFLYNSASRPDLQIEMGLFGALIVRPSGFAGLATPQAYGSPESRYDQEYLFLLSEMDSRIHDLVEQRGVAALDRSSLLANYFSNYWFINGRNAPDTMAEADALRLPTQPYNSLPVTHPGDRVLMRVVGGGQQMHPFHHHGNHARVIAVDGFPLESGRPGAPPLDLSHEVFTIQSLPGQTVDAIFRWTGKDLGWDIYGDPTDPAFEHECGPLLDAEGLDVTPRPATPTRPALPDGTREYCADHGKKLPVTFPEQLSLTYGGFWPGSPYMGTLSLLPPGEGGMNPNAAFTYMWHSHTEKEITNFDIFPGGMMTMLLVEPMHVPLQQPIP